MKELFKAITDAITNNVAAIRWVDFDLGQLEQEKPPVSWPCVLIQFQDGVFENLGLDTQQATLSIRVRLAFNVFERTHSKAETSFREVGIAHLDILSQVHAALQGLSGTSFSALNRESFNNEVRADYRVYNIIYSALYCEQVTTTENTYQPWDQVSSEPLELCTDPSLELQEG